MVGIAECGHPGLRGGDQEREGHQRCGKRKQTTQQTQTMGKRIGQHQQCDGYFHYPQAEREAVGVVGGLPFALLGNQFALMREVRFVLFGVLVEERHDRAVSHERRDAVSLIRDKLECTDPQKHNSDTKTDKHRAKLVELTE
ncbi:hypothetical protein D3C77_631900 [compost metagenome]